MKDNQIIKAYQAIIKAQESTIDSLLGVIESQSQVISGMENPPAKLTFTSYAGGGTGGKDK